MHFIAFPDTIIRVLNMCCPLACLELLCVVELWTGMAEAEKPTASLDSFLLAIYLDTIDP